MEGITFTGEHDSDDDSESGGKKKRRAEAIGAFAVEPKTAKTEAKKPSFLDELLGKKAEAEPKTAETDEPAVESDEQLAALSADEKLYAEQEIVHELQTVAPEAPVAEVDDAVVAGEMAVERFRDKIVAEDKPSAQALAETLNELDSNTEPTIELPAETLTIETPQEFTDEAVELNQPAAVETAPVDTAVAAAETQPAAAASGTLGGGSPAVAAGGRLFAPVPVMAPRVNSAEVPAARVEQDGDSSDFVAGTLVGGVVGYLLGRRRERIKTERRLLPVQQRLEQQVGKLQQDIIAKEFMIRRAAAERSRDQVSGAETHPLTTDRQTPVEAVRARGSRAPAEQIGAMLIATQAEATLKPERASLETIDRHVGSLRRADLLELSGKVTVEGTNLRRAYETGLLNEKALRRIIIEHLRGGDVRAALGRELAARRIGFERDPQTRDSSQSSPPPGSGTHSQLQQLLQQASAQLSGVNQSAANDSRATGTAARRPDRRRVFDYVMAGTIALLIILILVLLIRG